MRLIVTYYGDGSSEFDESVVEALKPLGAEFTGSGKDVSQPNGGRDLCFDITNKEEEE